MVIALLSTLLVVTLSGLQLYAIEEGRGPFAANPSMLTIIAAAHAEEDDEANKNAEADPDEEFWEEIHEGATNFMLVLIGLHVLGVVLSSKLHQESLIKAMITGKKPVK